MTIHQIEFENRLENISEAALSSQEELSRLAEHIDKLNTNIVNIRKKDISQIHEKGLLKINEDLNHICFLQDSIRSDLKLLTPVVNTLADQTFWLSNNIYWFTEIKPNNTFANILNKKDL